MDVDELIMIGNFLPTLSLQEPQNTQRKRAGKLTSTLYTVK